VQISNFKKQVREEEELGTPKMPAKIWSLSSSLKEHKGIESFRSRKKKHSKHIIKPLIYSGRTKFWHNQRLNHQLSIQLTMLKVIMRSGKPRLQYRESQRTLACLAMRLPRVRQLMSFLLLYQKQTPAHIPKNLQEDRAQEMKTPQGTGNRLDSINQASPLVKAKQKERLAICDRSLQGTILQCTSRKRPVVLNLLQEEDNRIHLARDWAPQCPVQEQEKSIIGYISSTARGSTSNGKRHPNSIRMK